MDVSNYYGKILIGKNVSVLKGFKKNSIDLTVTSPPYGTLRNYDGFVWDFNYFKLLAKELYRITKNGGILVWVVGDQNIDGSESLSSFRQAVYFTKCGFNLHDTMIYEKHTFAHPENNRCHQMFEYMFVFSKSTPKTFNKIYDKRNVVAGNSHAPTRREKDGTITKLKWVKVAKYGSRGNIWKYSVGKGLSTKYDKALEHPAIFPEKLAEDHIVTWSNEGDVVLDCFMGSGTTAIAAIRKRRNWIGIESSEEYVNNIAIPRIKYEKKRMSKRIGRK